VQRNDTKERRPARMRGDDRPAPSLSDRTRDARRERVKEGVGEAALLGKARGSPQIRDKRTGALSLGGRTFNTRDTSPPPPRTGERGT